MQNVFDDNEPLPVIMVIEGGRFSEIKKGTFIFTLDKNGEKFPQDPKDEEVKETSEDKILIENKFQPIKVDDNLDNYDATYEVKVQYPKSSKITTLPGLQSIRIWAKTGEVTFTSDDGKAHKNVKFHIVTTFESLSCESNGEGVWKGDLPMDEYTIEVDSPFEISELTKPKGRKREIRVTKKDFQAKFISPDPADSTKAIRQYVNKAEVTSWDKDNPKGSEVTFKIASKDDQGKQGDEVFIECKFSRESKRDDPKPVLIPEGLDGALVESDEGKTYKAKIKLAADKTATFKVKLGISGGDTCSVKIGSTDACGDEELKFENWRKLYYETVHPSPVDPNKVSDFGSLTGDNEAGLKNEMKLNIKAAMEECYIDLQESRKAFYDSTTINASNIVDASYVELGTESQKAVILTSDQLDKVRNNDALTKYDKENFSLYWTDILVDDEMTSIVSIDIEDLESAKGVNYNYLNNKRVFKNRLGEGGSSVKIKWQISAIKKRKKWKNVTDADLVGNLKGKNKPTAVPENEHEKFFTFKNWKNCEIKLPADVPADPGNMLEVDGNIYKITVSFEIYCYKEIAGQAANGKISLPSRFNSKILTQAIVHEMGHCLGQGYMEKADLIQSQHRWGRNKKYIVLGIKTPDFVPKGYIYSGRNHTGPHCAHGLSDKQRKKESFTGDSFKNSAKCVMFGNVTEPPSMKFCPQCKELVKAEELEDIKRNWYKS